MRDLKRFDKNRLVIDDAVSGTKIGFFYSTPTASQFKTYRQQSIRRHGGKVVLNSFDPALRAGLEIITGFDEGSFGYGGNPISSDPNSPYFREDWKDLLSETAADLVTLLAHVVFDGAKVEKDDAGIAFEGEVTEDALPLGKS